MKGLKKRTFSAGREPGISLCEPYSLVLSDHTAGAGCAADKVDPVSGGHGERGVRPLQSLSPVDDPMRVVTRRGAADL